MAFNPDINGMKVTGAEAGVAALAIKDNFQELGHRARKSNLDAVVAPTAADNLSTGYRHGSRWLNTATGIPYVCVGSDMLAAVWQVEGGALLDSPHLTGVPTAPTAVQGTNTTQIATTEFCRTEITTLVDSSPASLDTLNELATALGNDPNFATTVIDALADKVSKGGDTMLGDLEMGPYTVTADTIRLTGDGLFFYVETVLYATLYAASLNVLKTDHHFVVGESCRASSFIVDTGLGNPRTINQSSGPNVDIDGGLTLAGNTKANQHTTTVQALTDAATVTWNMNSGADATLLLTTAVGATRSFGTPTNIKAGTTYTVRVKQPASGGPCTLVTWPAAFKWAGGVIPELSTAAGAEDIFTFKAYDTTSLYGVATTGFA